MGKQAFQLDPGKLPNFTDCFYTFLRIRKTNAAHPCIHFNMHVHIFSLTHGLCRKLLCHVQPEHGGTDIQAHQFRVILRKYVARINIGFRIPFFRSSTASSMVAAANPHR